MAFAKTLIGTKNERGRELDICYGKFYFGNNQPGVNLGGGSTVRLFKDGPRSLAVTKVEASAEAGYFVGFCGLNYATHFYVEGKDNGANLDLTYSGPSGGGFSGEDGHAAGFFLGASVFSTVNLKFWGWAIRWKRKWGIPYPAGGTWADAGEFNIGYQLDFLNLLYEVFMSGEKKKKEGDKGTKAKKNEKEISVGAGGRGSSIALYDSSYGDLQEENTLTLEPSYDIKIDIVPFIPGVGKFATRVNKLPGSSLGIGAVVKILFPVDLTVKGLWVKRTYYTVSRKMGGGATATRTAQTDNRYKDNEIGLRLEHRPGIDIGVGPYAEFSLFWVFSIGFEKVWKLGELVPQLQIRFGTFHNDYKSVVGARSPIAATEPDESFADTLPEIVFDEPVFA